MLEQNRLWVECLEGLESSFKQLACSEMHVGTSPERFSHCQEHEYKLTQQAAKVEKEEGSC